MAELFGSALPLWPSMPMPSFVPVASMPGSRTTMLVQPPPESASSMSVNWAAAPAPSRGGMLGVDFAAGMTPQALLVTVAMRRGQPAGPANDQDVEDFIYDALELLPGANDVEVRCESGRVMLSGTVTHKRLKRDAGEIAWAIPSVNDVQNNITIATRRRSRAQTRDMESGAPQSGRKPAA